MIRDPFLGEPLEPQGCARVLIVLAAALGLVAALGAAVLWSIGDAIAVAVLLSIAAVLGWVLAADQRSRTRRRVDADPMRSWERARRELDRDFPGEGYLR